MLFFRNASIRNSILTSVGVLAMCAGQAMGQDASLASVETEMNPQDLPGREPAPRSKPEIEQAEKKKTEAIDAAREPATRDWFGFRPWWEWSRATGDWGGVRTDLEAKGLTISGSFTHDWSGVFSGGLNERGSSRRLFDINATLDLDKAFGWKGGTVFADFYHYGGRLINDAGDIQSYDNIATDRHRDQLSELWFEQKLFDNVLRVKFGKVEANKEFAFINPATSFLHSSAAYSPNMLGFPTYPEPAMGVVAFVYPCDYFYAGFGFFDGATLDGLRTGNRAGFNTFFGDDKADGNFYIGEAGFTWKNFGKVGGRFGKGRVAGGVWHHSNDFARFDGGTDDGTTGGYVLGEQHVWKSNDDEASDKGLWVFARAAFADDKVASIGTHVGAGITLRGTFEGRENDEVGFLYNFADLSDKNTAFDGNEHAFEVFYRMQLFGSVVVTPDIQYISNPSGNNTIDDAVVGTLRVQVSF